MPDLIVSNETHVTAVNSVNLFGIGDASANESHIPPNTLTSGDNNHIYAPTMPVAAWTRYTSMSGTFNFYLQQACLSQPTLRLRAGDAPMSATPGTSQLVTTLVSPDLTTIGFKTCTIPAFSVDPAWFSTSLGTLALTAQYGSTNQAGSFRSGTLQLFAVENSFAVDSYSQTDFSVEGGETLTVTGTFPTAATFEVYVGTNGNTTDPSVYAGYQRAGIVKSDDGVTLSFVMPPNAAGSASLFFRRVDTVPIESLLFENVIRYQERPWRSTQFSMRRLLVPQLAVGKRRLDLEKIQ